MKIGNTTLLFKTIAIVNLLKKNDEDNAHYKRNLSEKLAAAITGSRKQKKCSKTFDW